MKMLTQLMAGLAGLAALHAKFKRPKRSWRITKMDGVWCLPPSGVVGTKPGWRFHSKRARKALNWSQFKEARRQMLAMGRVEGGA